MLRVVDKPSEENRQFLKTLNEIMQPGALSGDIRRADHTAASAVRNVICRAAAVPDGGWRTASLNGCRS